jgi:hypothetical protein
VCHTRRTTNPEEKTMTSIPKKLRLSRETLHTLEPRAIRGFDSCLDSCYLVSCGGDCGISTGVKTA